MGGVSVFSGYGYIDVREYITEFAGVVFTNEGDRAGEGGVRGIRVWPPVGRHRDRENYSLTFNVSNVLHYFTKH